MLVARRISARKSRHRLLQRLTSTTSVSNDRLRLTGDADRRESVIISPVVFVVYLSCCPSLGRLVYSMAAAACSQPSNQPQRRAAPRYSTENHSHFSAADASASQQQLLPLCYWYGSDGALERHFVIGPWAPPRPTKRGCGVGCRVTSYLDETRRTLRRLIMFVLSIRVAGRANAHLAGYIGLLRRTTSHWHERAAILTACLCSTQTGAASPCMRDSVALQSRYCSNVALFRSNWMRSQGSLTHVMQLLNHGCRCNQRDKIRLRPVTTQLASFVCLAWLIQQVHNSVTLIDSGVIVLLKMFLLLIVTDVMWMFVFSPNFLILSSIKDLSAKWF